MLINYEVHTISFTYLSDQDNLEPERNTKSSGDKDKLDTTEQGEKEQVFYLTSLCKRVSGKKLRRFAGPYKNREETMKISVIDEKENKYVIYKTMCIGEISRTLMQETRTQAGSGIVAHIQQTSHST